MKKLFVLTLIAALSLSVMACGSKDSTTTTDKGNDSNVEATVDSQTVNIMVQNAQAELVEVAFPVNPQSVAVLNYQTLDYMDTMGLGHLIKGVSKGSLPAHLKHYAENDDIVDLGTLKDIDMEALASLNPDIIFSSDRSVAHYDTFSQLAPTMACAVVYGDGFMNSYKELATKHAQIFDMEAETAEILTDYEERVQTIHDEFEGSTALLGIFAGGLNTLGDTGRCNVITTDMGFTNLAAGKDVQHGNKSSYEVFLELDPEYVFIIDKDTAVGTNATAAKQQMENDIIKQTSAYQNDQIIYLEPGDCWYLADGGITSLDLMLSDLETKLGL